MKKIFFLLAVLFILSPAQVYAAQNFSSDYNVIYEIKENGQTRVSIDAVLTNLTSQYYASSYKIQVGFKDISNLTASDTKGTLKTEVIKNSKGSSVELNFNEKIVGEDKKLNFKVSFDTSEVAESQGKVWEINIPGLSNQNDFNTYNVSVIYPNKLGKPAYIKPKIEEFDRIIGNKLSFSKTDLGTSGISLGFGESQIYDFKVQYHLRNNNVFPVTEKIALPSTTNYQDVLLKDLSPKPVDVVMDRDGNWLASYFLYPFQKMNITATGKTILYLIPKKERLTKDQANRYLAKESYWETDNSKIKELALKLKTPVAIYDYVVENLTYDFTRVTSRKKRLGALGVLNDNNSAVCLEFTDLFIALARAAGIPAREVDGFANTKNPKERPLSLVQDVLHAWPEYYDYGRETWIMIDPTWGNTTGGVDYFNVLDFDHFAFVRRGLDSSYPVPAGGYKDGVSENSKDVEVILASESVNPTKTLKVQTELSEEYVGGQTINGKIKIFNIGNALSDNQELAAYTSTLLPSRQKLSLPKIPPYGSTTIPFELKGTDILTNKSDIVRIQFGRDSIQKNIKIIPFFLTKWFVLGGVVIVSIGTIISVITFGVRRLSLSRRK